MRGGDVHAAIKDIDQALTGSQRDRADRFGRIGGPASLVEQTRALQRDGSCVVDAIVVVRCIAGGVLQAQHATTDRDGGCAGERTVKLQLSRAPQNESRASVGLGVTHVPRATAHDSDVSTDHA